MSAGLLLRRAEGKHNYLHLLVHLGKGMEALSSHVMVGRAFNSVSVQIGSYTDVNIHGYYTRTLTLFHNV